MKLKFKSIINQNNETKNIEFTVPVDIYEDDKFKSFAFYEPNTNLRSMIEINDAILNIHNNSSTISLKYQEECDFDLEIIQNNKLFSIPCKTFWKSKEFSENYYNFTYTLISNEKLFGEFNITLEIIE
ncbi:hypothetical protein RRG51_01175 [Mycoplasmopsis cynos]|uniref:hypothetical protein n=1 Tax=Mycoplasmopsis cynos TaxID=171284 RepID=UPI002B00035F|nr:hypothetical protein [Mycoplasmopsis cynos]WQQ16363.1 hypothetical protein RRG51_01175 [Mycoplasmopsis cynos]